MVNSDIIYLNSPEGKKLLEKYQNLSDVDLYRELMKAPKTKNPHLSAAVTLIKLRHKAAGKFSKSEAMFFTPLSLEQSTGENIAKYISSRFGRVKKIVDLTSSIGGNLIFLADQAEVLVAVDKNETNLLCAELNCHLYHHNKNIEYICGDAQKNIISDADAFFIDPSRERSGKTKTKSIINCEPSLIKIIPEIFKVTPNLGAKISPAFDYQEIKLLSSPPEIEVISEDNVCKVVMLWFGKYKTCARRATCLIGEKIYSYQDKVGPKVVSIAKEPLKYLYEPNKAITKAHLIEEVAEKFHLQKLNRETSFLTSDDIIQSHQDLFRILEVIHFAPFSLKEIKQELSDKNISRVNIITKRFPQKPLELYKKLKIKEGGDIFLIITIVSSEKYYFILAKK
jgi:hypothetical protein